MNYHTRAYGGNCTARRWLRAQLAWRNRVNAQVGAADAMGAGRPKR
jgi:hypothetical protein